MTYDIFISHADEDSEFAILLAEKLKSLDLTVFLDKNELKAGDSLSSTINRAVLDSRFAVIIASPIYFEKKWAMRELGAILAREDIGKMSILPLLHELDNEELRDVFPILADKLTLSSSDDLDQVANNISEAVASNTSTEAHRSQPIDRPSKNRSTDRSSMLKLWRPLGEFSAQWQTAFRFAA